MSRYRDSGNTAYRDGPPPMRWDADRFARERDYRSSYDEYYESPQRPPPGPPPRQRAPVYEDERFYYEDDRYGPNGSRVDRRYYEEDEYYDPRARQGQMVPYRPDRGPRPGPPPRPGLLRRQSSLDTFDRPPARRVGDYDGYRPPRGPSRTYINVPDPPSPRTNRYRRSRPNQDYYEERDYYDDVQVQDPDYYGDEGFREFREREWVRHRRDSSSSSSSSRTASKAPTEAPAPAPPPAKEEVKEEKKEIVRKEEVKDEFKEEVKEKPYPRRGKTKMPKRLVHTKVLFDLGYAFYEENEKTIIIEKALGPDNIDEVFAKSREYREQEVSTTRMIEAPPASRAPTNAPSARGSVHESLHESFHESIRDDRSVKAPTTRAPSVRAETVKDETLKESEVKTIPMSEAPRSVREWDQLEIKEEDSRTVRSSSRRRSSARSKSRHTRRSPSPKETIVERRSTVIDREPSPTRTAKTSKSRRTGRSRSRHASRASYDETEFIERKIITEEDDYGPLESDSVHVGPLALVVDRSRPGRDERELKEEIRALEAERRALRRERRHDRDDDIVKVERIERRVSRSPSPLGEIIVDRRGDDVVEVRKDRRERSVSRTRAPSAGLIRSMLYTVT